MDSRDMAQGGSCGRNARGRDRGLVDSERPRASHLHGHKTVRSHRPHTEEGLCTLQCFAAAIFKFLQRF